MYVYIYMLLDSCAVLVADGYAKTSWLAYSKLKISRGGGGF